MASKEEIQKVIAEIFAPKKKVAKKEPKFVMVVNGVVASQRPADKKDLEAAVIAIKVKNPGAKILAYKLQGELTLDLPVSGINEEEA